MIESAVPNGMKVIDSAESTADAATRLINGSATSSDPIGELLQTLTTDIDPSPEPLIRCFATDSVEKFERLGSRFLGRPTGQVQLVDLGG
jgi:glutamate racemase